MFCILEIHFIQKNKLSRKLFENHIFMLTESQEVSKYCNTVVSPKPTIPSSNQVFFYYFIILITWVPDTRGGGMFLLLRSSGARPGPTDQQLCGEGGGGEQVEER